MSVDFGNIPLPYSPLQDYFDRKYCRGSSESASPTSSVVSSPIGGPNSDYHFAKALADLAKKQDAEPVAETIDAQIGSRPPTDATGQNQRRESLATSSGYGAVLALGLLKRRSVTASNPQTNTAARNP